MPSYHQQGPTINWLAKRRMRYLIFSLSLVILVFSGCASDDADLPGDTIPDVVDFNFHVKPILSDRCFKCHGPDEQAREAGLRLDTPEGAFAALASDSALVDSIRVDSIRYAIVPGRPELSEVITRIKHPDPEERMPHPESKLFLSEAEIRIIEKWVAQGAEWKTHWSFIVPEKSELPDVRNADWARHPLDYFVLAKLETKGLQPAEEESPAKWLRRASFDLTGLPPTLEAVESLQQDPSEEAYAQAVDRLLDSPAFGERMASVWLDASRYADSHGYQDDRPRTMWPWRDWVIDAFNDNMSYDQFLTLQLAGDLLPNATYEQKLATGFNRNHGITQEGGVVNDEYVTEYVADRTNTMSTAMLGLTVECARCHDHKYDPITQKEYYQMFSFFNGIDERGQINYFDLSPKPNMRMEDAEFEALIEQLAVDTEAAAKQYSELWSAPAGTDFTHWLEKEKPSVDLDVAVQNGLISHYKFDRLSAGETPDQISTDRTGKINTRLLNVLADPVIVEGAVGKAIKFDGENYINLGDVGDFDHADRFSIGAWIQQAGSFEKDVAILVKRNEEQKRGGYQLVLTKEGNLKASLIHNQNSERIEVITKTRVPADTWAHVFLTYDGSGKAAGLQVYVDGKPQRLSIEKDSLARRSLLNGNDILAGNWTTRNTGHASFQGFKDGTIDDIRIYDRELTALEVMHLARSNSDAPSDAEYADEKWLAYFKNHQPDVIRARERLDSLRAIHLEVPFVMVMEEMAEPRKTHVLARGAYDAPQEEVTSGTPVAILAFPEDYPKNRLGLARWITHAENPLTARVAVNRFWQLLFGRGIVATPEDFGSQGALPSHPEMLDWLAVEFRESDWDVKAFMKSVVLSSTYRQSARITEKKHATDPENILLARGPAQRFSAEMVRDNALKVSGLLVEKTGGPWVKPYQPPGVWKELANQIGENKYRPSKGPDLYRRSLYSYWKRTIPPPAMLTFDAAERTVCVVKRQTTSTPLQSLVLLNDPQMIEAARKLAERTMVKEETLEDQLSLAFKLLTSREPDGTEMQVLSSLYEDEHARFENEEVSTDALLNVGFSQRDAKINKTSLAAMTVVINTMMNMDEAKMRS